MRACLAAETLACLLVSLPVHAAVGLEQKGPPTVPQEQRTLEDVAIKGVIPSTARPGEDIRIYFDRTLASMGEGLTRSIDVQIDGRRAPVLGSSEPNILIAQVPTDLAAGELKLQVIGPTFISTYPIKVIGSATVFDAWTLSIGGMIAAVVVIVIGFGVAKERKAAKAARREAEDLRFRLQQQLSGQGVPSGDVGKPAEASPTPREEPSRGFTRKPLEPFGIPSELVEQIAKRQCVLYWGGGVSAQASYPTWAEALDAIAKKHSIEEVGPSLAAGKLAIVAELLVSRLGREGFIEEARALWGGDSDMPMVAQLLAEIPFSNVVTSTWDRLAETAFASRSPQVVSGVRGRNVDSVLSEEFSLIRLWGRLEEPTTMILTHNEYRSASLDNPAYKRYLSSLTLSQSHLFIGCSLSTIEEYLEGSGQRGSERRHYALVHETEDIAAAREVFRVSYGVELITFRATPGWPQLEQFATELVRVVEVPAAKVVAQASNPRLERLDLRNIGPFEELHLQLQPDWNLFLGNNGSGKSTILRAIALCLCGRNPKAELHAGRLLRAQTDEGQIDITIGGETYTTILKRSGTRVEVVSRRETPISRGGFLALAFAPLRGISPSELTGPTSSGTTSGSAPVVDDLLPLLAGPTDPRLTDLKQWIVNLDVLSTAATGVTQDQADRHKALKKRFFELLRDFVPGSKLEFAEVQRSPVWEVRVETDDGVVSIDQVSQGMSSIIGWIGPLLQRMYETHTGGEPAEDGRAVVLIDEIDAHLHPHWQQIIVGTLKKHFKNVQFIATTHSPLIVGELTAAQIHRVERVGKRVHIAPPLQDPRGLGVAGLLTSEMFGLRTHLDSETEKKLTQKRKLALIPLDKRSEQQNADLARLDMEVGGVDLTKVVRDPLYPRFVEALASIEKDFLPPGVPSKEEQAHMRRNAEAAVEAAHAALKAEESKA